jgi:hypothetical protein
MSLKDNAQVHEAAVGADVTPGNELNSILMSWEIKAHAHPTLFMDIGMAVLGAFPLMFYLYGVFFHENDDTRHSFINSGMFGVALVLFIWVMIVRQKTFYSYRFTEKGGEVDYWLHFPKCAGWIFKGIAIFVLVTVLSIVAIMPVMIFALVGIGALTIPAALKLLAWENEINGDDFEWDRVQLILADRKRSLVVLQRKYDPDIPFEQNFMYFRTFLPKHRFDEFLCACKRYAPSTVDFEEGDAGY